MCSLAPRLTNAATDSRIHIHTLERRDRDRRSARRVPGHDQAQAALREREVRRLRRVRAGLPGEGHERVRLRRHRAHRDLAPVRQRRALDVRHRPQGLVALQDGLPGAHLGPGLRGAGRRGPLRRRLPRRQRAQPVPQRLRPHLHARLRDRVHARPGRGADRHRRPQALRGRHRVPAEAAGAGDPARLRRDGRDRRRRPGRPDRRARAGPLRLRGDRLRGAAVAGGMLRVGIPEYRLPQDVLAARDRPDHRARRRAAAPVSALRQRLHRRLAARRRLQGRLPRHRPAEEQGAAAARPRAAGRRARGRVPARAGRSARRPTVGKRVVVIGGGDVAFDAGRTALPPRRRARSRWPASRTSAPLPASRRGDRGGPRGAGPASSTRSMPVEILGDGRRGHRREVPALHAGRAQRARLAPAGCPSRASSSRSRPTR